MSLAAQQRLLARLYTEAGFRRRFYQDPEAVADEFGLSRLQARAIAGLPARQVQTFAGSLRRKRLLDLAKVLPATCRLLGTRLDRLFDRYLEDARSGGAQAAIEDALRFAEFLQRQAATVGSVFDGADAAMARYEAARLRAARVPIVLRCFQFEVRARLRAASRGRPVPPPLRKMAIGIWFRLSPRGRLRHALLSFPGSLAPFSQRAEPFVEL